jgi:hypothetical protein
MQLLLILAFVAVASAQFELPLYEWSVEDTARRLKSAGYLDDRIRVVARQFATDRRVRVLETQNDRVMKERVEPRCEVEPFDGRRVTFVRVASPERDSYFFSTNHTEILDAKRYGGFDNMEMSLGQLSRDSYRDTCECLIPLYKRQYDSRRFRFDFATQMTMSQSELNNWSIEGFCVPRRGMCGANVQLVRFVPPRHLNNPQDTMLTTSIEDRTQYGETKGWTEQTLCYMWE